MFTGIIEEVGHVKSLRQSGDSAILEVQAKKVLEGTKIGDSIAVNGVCLTLASIRSKGFTADIMPETIIRSALGELFQGTKVNLERALRLGDRLGGHWVSGHIDGTGIIISKTHDQNAIRIKIATEQKLLRFIIEKGSVTVDGISLTVAACSNRDFEISLIPYTLRETTLNSRQAGEKVNIECDILGKYVSHLLRQASGNVYKGVSEEFLAENGFM